MKTNAEKLYDLSVPRDENEERACRERKSRAPYAKTVAKIVLAVLYYMDKKGISQKSLAETMGVSPAYVNKLLRGKENLTIETISKVESALGESLINVVDPERQHESIKISAIHFNDNINIDWSKSRTFKTSSSISSFANEKTA